MLNKLDEYYDISLKEEDYRDLKAIHKAKSEEVLCKYDLDIIEKTICWIAGLTAGAMDAFLLEGPHIKTKGFLNEKADALIRNLFSPEQIAKLERANWVPYDVPNSINLDNEVSGLYTRSHRFQSLGHDPILGFFFGVRDIITNSFTCYNSSGKLIVQSIRNSNMNMNIFEAIIRQIGHLKSDISTPAGLPIPFMPLLQSIQTGDINGKTIGEVSRLMYVKGYNLNHLMAMSIPAIVIELITRSLYLVYGLCNKKSIEESLPFNKPKIDKMLFISYMIATGCNSIKIITHQGNIFAVNPTIWAGTIKYGYSELKRGLRNERESERHQYLSEFYKKYGEELDRSLEKDLAYYI
jgi:hypothetical protein